MHAVLDFEFLSMHVTVKMLSKMQAMRSFSRRGMSSKVVASAEEAIHDLVDGSTICVGGFGLCGIPGEHQRQHTALL